MNVRSLSSTSITRLKLVILMLILVFIVAGCGVSDSPSASQSTPVPLSFSYQVRVQDKSTGEGIERARVTINVAGQAPIDELTDSNGLARIFISSSHANKPGQLQVEANGFKVYTQNI